MTMVFFSIGLNKLFVIHRVGLQLFFVNQKNSQRIIVVIRQMHNLEVAID